MKAALVAEPGGVPVVDEVAAPIGGDEDVVVQLEAASLNPVDIAIASGGFYAGHPPMPYVPAIEAVGRAPDGSRVFVLGAGLGISRNGTCSEQFIAPRSTMMPLREDIDAGVAAALGTAALAGWLPVVWRAGVTAGETVIVLGATGTAGFIAVQAARLNGASHIVAAGRDPVRLEQLGSFADEIVSLDDDDLAARFQAAAPDGADVVFDALWGEPLEAALTATSVGGRVVHIGQSASATAQLSSAVVRGRQLTIIGYSNFGVPRTELEQAYGLMVDLAVTGELVLPVIQHPLDDIALGWAGAAESTGKHVVTPS